MKKLMLVSIVLFGCLYPVLALDNVIRVDANARSVGAGVTSGNEIRNILTDDNGKIMVVGVVTTSGTSDVSVISIPNTQNARSSTGTYNQVSIGTTETVIRPINTSRKSIIVRNHGSSDVYVGLGTVTISTGLKLEQGQAISYDNYTGTVEGIISSGSATISYQEI